MPCLAIKLSDAGVVLAFEFFQTYEGGSMASGFYQSLKSGFRRLGLDEFLNDVLARVSDRDRVFRQNREILCQSMFHEFCRLEGIERHFYPVGGAANYSLMYVLARVCTECPVRSVLELGAGQSTVFMNEMRKKKDFEMLSLEGSSFWAEHMRSQVATDLLHSPLVDVMVEGVAVRAYDVSLIPLGRKFDVVLIDGPTGVSHFSRAGCLEILKRHLDDEFLLIFDDAERAGEQETIALVEAWMKAQGRSYKKHEVTGMSTQTLLASPGFTSAVYY